MKLIRNATDWYPYVNSREKIVCCMFFFFVNMSHTSTGTECRVNTKIQLAVVQFCSEFFFLFCFSFPHPIRYKETFRT